MDGSVCGDLETGKIVIYKRQASEETKYSNTLTLIFDSRTLRLWSSVVEASVYGTLLWKPQQANAALILEIFSFVKI